MRPAALLLHGFAGSPRIFDGLGAALVDAGVEVEAPRLPGHGTDLDDFERTGWADWVEAARAADQRVQAPGRPVVLVGHSMGGALACRLEADHPGAAGLVAVNPFVDPPAPSFVEILHAVRDQGHRCVPFAWNDVAAPGVVQEGAYPDLPVPPLLSLCAGLETLRPDLGRVACPVLLLTSRTDHVVPTESSDLLAASVQGPVERVWLERSWHLAPIDHDRAEVEERTVGFVLARTGVRPGP